MKFHKLSAGAEAARRNMIVLCAKRRTMSARKSAAMRRRWAEKRGDDLSLPSANEEEHIEIAQGDTLLDDLPEGG